MGAKALILLVFIALSGVVAVYYDAQRVLAGWWSSVLPAGSGEATQTFSCNIWVERSSFNYERGSCITTESLAF